MDLKSFIENVQSKISLFCEISFSKTADETEMLKNFCKTCLTDRRREEAWSQIIYSLNETFYPQDITDFLSQEVLEFLVENKISLNSLGHLQLSNQWLLKIYEKDNNCIEALQTIVRRHYEYGK